MIPRQLFSHIPHRVVRYYLRIYWPPPLIQPHATPHSPHLVIDLTPAVAVLTAQSPPRPQTPNSTMKQLGFAYYFSSSHLLHWESAPLLTISINCEIWSFCNRKVSGRSDWRTANTMHQGLFGFLGGLLNGGSRHKKQNNNSTGVPGFEWWETIFLKCDKPS